MYETELSSRTLCRILERTPLLRLLLLKNYFASLEKLTIMQEFYQMKILQINLLS